MRQFDSWFGNSVTKHSDGTPITFYHGTGSDISEFSPTHISGGNQWGRGFYFTPSAKIASDYATGTTTGVHARISSNKSGSPNVIPVHLKMEKPFVMDAPVDIGLIRKIEKKLGESLKDHVWAGMRNRDIHQQLHLNHLSGGIDAANDMLRGFGYDGIKELGQDSTHMVFDPTHVKSAIGNSGTYSKRSSSLVEGIQAFLIEAKSGDYSSIKAQISPEIIDAVQNAKFSVDPIQKEKLHCTLCYSIGTAVDRQKIQEYLDAIQTPLTGKVTHLTKFDALPKDGKRPENKCTIVMEVECPELDSIHRRLKKMGMKHSYPDFRPHVSLVYDVPIDEAVIKMKRLDKLVRNQTVTFNKPTIEALS